MQNMMQVRGEMCGKLEKMRNVIFLNSRDTGVKLAEGFIPGTEVIYLTEVIAEFKPWKTQVIFLKPFDL